MKTKNIITRTTGAVLILILSVAAATNIAAQTSYTFQSRAFGSPGEAADALLSAASVFDEIALRDILGPDSYDVIHSGEPALDKQTAMEFGALGAAKKTTTLDPKSKARAFLLVGDDDWPFPIPIVKQAGKWYFDTRAGRQEILYRRVGRNELSAIKACRGYVEAQQEYSLTKHDGALVNQFAQRLVSSPGKQDGLAWQNPDGTWGGTVGEQAAKEIQSSYTGERKPYHGYYFKILTGQGPAAQLGEMDFMVKGAMIGGFALLAVPAIYKVTGVKSFIVSHEGIVYEKDLGPGGIEAAKSIDRYNPDRTWSVVKD